MSSRRKPLEMNAASIVGLKAELYRKREEALQAASQPKPANRVSKKPPIWARTKTKDTKTANKSEPTPDNNKEEIDLLARSRQMLEAKSRLYEELTQSALPAMDQDEESGYLVDFERKTLENTKAEAEHTEAEKQLEVNEALDDENTASSANEEEEDWVEYIDVFGRNRRCLREDLPHHLKRNDDLREDLSKEAARKEEEEAKQNEKEVDGDDAGSPEYLQSRTCDHQSTRQDNESLFSVDESDNSSKVNLYYADVQGNEIRDHGVSFFQFSTDEATRQQQLKQLNQMRKLTEESRERRERIKEKRKAQMELRLAKVKQRRMISDGEKTEASPAPISETEEEKRITSNEAIAAKLSELRAQVEQCQEKKARINTLFPRREWDRGKAMMSAEKYLEKRRSERCSDFAPPSSYRR